MMWDSFPDIRLVLERKAHMDKIERIKELHSSFEVDAGASPLGKLAGRGIELYCKECEDSGWPVPWPCETREICDEEIN